MPDNKVKHLVEKLKLNPHPEGGYYREVYRSSGLIDKTALPNRFSGDRNYMTSIYFLIEQGYFSAFHRIMSDELWYFHNGAGIKIHVIHKDGSYVCHEMGMDKALQCVIPACCWFAAETTGEYSLVSCAVAPGFDFEDFELAEGAQLSTLFPQHKNLIESFCRN